MKTDLRIFVYGTLKKGFSNHRTYCDGVSRIEPARICGRLFKLTPEIPVMIIPEGEIIAIGSGDVAADMRLPAALGPGGGREGKAGTVARKPAEKEAGMRGPGNSGPDNGWKAIRGELLFFNDPETRLPLMDGLEEFQPGEQSTYIRVLARVVLADGSPATAWTYIAGFDTEGLESYEGENWFPD